MNKLKVAYWFGKTLYFGCWIPMIACLFFLKGVQQLFGVVSMFSLGIVGFISWMIARDKLTDSGIDFSVNTKRKEN